MQLYDKPRSTTKIGQRVKGVARDTMQFVPETVSWFATSAPVTKPEEYRRAPQTVLNNVSSYVAQREAFAGVSGAMYQARARVLAIKDPELRATGMTFIEGLMRLPYQRQVAALALLRNQHDPNASLQTAQEQAAVYGTSAGEDIEQAALSGGVQVDQNVVHTGTDKYGVNLAVVLNLVFPEGYQTQSPDAEQVLYDVVNDVSEAALEPAVNSASINALADAVTDPNNSLTEKFWKTTLAVTGVASEYTWDALGTTGRFIGAEGIVDDVASAWDSTEMVIGEQMVGYYDPITDTYHNGLLTLGLDRPAPTDPDYEEKMRVWEQQVTDRGNAFGLLTLFAGGAAGITAGAVGRRIKSIRSIVGVSDDAVRAILPDTIKPAGGTGIIDKALEVYRTPARAVSGKFDDFAIARFRVDPDKFFHESMFGKLHLSGGQRLLNALAAAKRKFPGDSQDNIDAQAGWLRDRYGNQMPDALVRKMLEAPSVEDAKIAFVDYATHQQGQLVVKKLLQKKMNAQARVREASRVMQDGEEQIVWSRNLRRYNELNDAERQAERDVILGDQEVGGTGMDANEWSTLTPEAKQERIDALKEEVELSDLRKKLGFTPTPTDRMGRDFTPGLQPPPKTKPRYTKTVDEGATVQAARDYENLLRAFITAVKEKENLGPGAEWAAARDKVDDIKRRLTAMEEAFGFERGVGPGGKRKTERILENDIVRRKNPDLPSEGTVVNMPTAEVNELADPTLWDPETSQGQLPEWHAEPRPPEIFQRPSPDPETGEVNSYQFWNQMHTSWYDSPPDRRYAYAYVSVDDLDDGLRTNFATEGELAWALLSDDDMGAELVLIRVRRDKLEALGTPEEQAAFEDLEFLPKNLAGLELSDIEQYTGVTEVNGAAIWDPAEGRTLAAQPGEEFSQEVLEAASLDTREAIRRYSNIIDYPNLRSEDPILESIDAWVASQMPVGITDANGDILFPEYQQQWQEMRDMFDATKTQIGPRSYVAEIGIPENSGLPSGMRERIFWTEGPDGKIDAMLHTSSTQPLDPETGLPNMEKFDLWDQGNIDLKSRRGTEGGKVLLADILAKYKPSPQELYWILENNTLTRKSAMAVQKLLKREVGKRTKRIGKLSYPEYESLKADIAANGIHEPLEISVNPNTGEAVASEGFHRWLIARELGIEEVPVKIDYDPNVTGPQFMKAIPDVPEPSAQDLQKLVRARLELQDIERQLTHSTDNMPMLHYPSLSHIRAVVRAPATAGERVVAKILKVARMGPGQFADLAKWIDELPKRPEMYVPDNADNPADWLDRNTTTMQNYLRRAGVPQEQAQAAIGKLSRQRTAQEYYEVLENEIFGEGGLIDMSLTPEVKANADLRSSIITLHGRTPETRTRSLVRNTVEVSGGRTAVDVPVLGVQKGNELHPIPSRPTEFLNRVNLPDVDRLIEATSIIRRLVRQGEKAGVGPVNAAAIWNVPKIAMRIQTAVLKPAVMIVRLPAMGMRIQLEQSLRLLSSGYRPTKGFPDGLTMFPGGIPVPFTKFAAAATGDSTIPHNYRILSNLFGEDGWNLIDPDPRYKGINASRLPVNGEIGGFLDENTQNAPPEVHAVSTVDLKDDPGKILPIHTDSHRKELEMAHADWLDRKIAKTMDRGRVKQWLLSRRKGREFMETQMKPQLVRSNAYRTIDNVDGLTINIPAEEAAKYVEFPDRLQGAGRTPEQMDQLRKDMENGYDPNHVPENTLSGEPVGNLVMEYNPATGKAVIREGHHRIGVMLERGDNVNLEIKVVGDTNAVKGAKIEEQAGAAPALAELSNLNADTADVGKIFDMDQYTGTEEVRLENAMNVWLDQRIAYINQITAGGDVDMMDYIKTGKLRIPATGRDGVRVFDDGGGHIQQRYRELNHDIENIRIELSERYRRGDHRDPATRDEYVALQRTLKARERKMANLMDEHASELNVSYVRSTDEKKFRKALKDKWQSNPDSIPERIMLETGGFRRNPEVGLTEDLHNWAEAASTFMYRPFKALSAVDRHGTRGSLWSQQYERSVLKYQKLGYPTKQAKAIAYAEAGNITRDLMYDLNARTSVQRALKDIFWFAPATQEVVYTWLVKIPSQSYWPLGIISLYSKLKLGMGVLKALNVVTETADGEEIIQVPGLSRVVEMMTGKQVPEFVYGKTKGLNLVTQGVFPGIPGGSTGANFLLGRASLKWGGAFKAMSDVFQPYGPEASILPAPVTFWHEAVFGEAPPFEVLSGAYTKASWDRAHDQALQYAYHDLHEQGIVPPRVENFGEADETGRIVLSTEQEAAYQAARDEYLDELTQVGNDYAQGIAWTRLLGSTVMPMSLYTSSAEREAWDRFWTELTGGDHVPLNDTQKATINDYLEEHPSSLAFSVFTTKYGEKKRDLPFGESLDDAYYDAAYTGAASTLSPDEYSAKLMAWESRRFYQAQLDTALREVSPNMDPWVLLEHNNIRSAALTRYNEQWQRYLDLNPEVDNLLSEQSRLWAETNDIPKRSFEAERLANTLSLLKQVTPMLTGEDNIRPEEIRAVQGQIAALYGDTGEFPEPSTPSAKAIGWWYDTVLDPYLTKTADLYDQAQDLQTRGLDASEVYDQIRQLANQPVPMYKNGTRPPSVEQFFWGNKTKAEQDAAVITWATRPIVWLTDFQREKVGYQVSDDSAAFLDYAADYDTRMYDELDAAGISSGSKAYEDRIEMRDQWLASQAAIHGPEAVALWNLSESPPIARVTASGFGKGNTAWEDVVASAQYAYDRIVEDGYSPRSYSQDSAMYWKEWFYNELSTKMASNPQLVELFQGLEKSFPMDDNGWRQGVVLYEALFFGAFNEQYIPEELAMLGGSY